MVSFVLELRVNINTYCTKTMLGTDTRFSSKFCLTSLFSCFLSALQHMPVYCLEKILAIFDFLPRDFSPFLYSSSPKFPSSLHSNFKYQELSTLFLAHPHLKSQEAKCPVNVVAMMPDHPSQ